MASTFPWPCQRTLAGSHGMAGTTLQRFRNDGQTSSQLCHHGISTAFSHDVRVDTIPHHKALAVARLFSYPHIANATDLAAVYTPQRESEVGWIYAAAAQRGVSMQLLPLGSPWRHSATGQLRIFLGGDPPKPTVLLMVEGDRLHDPAWSLLRRLAHLVILTGCQDNCSPLDYLTEFKAELPARALLQHVWGASDINVRSGSQDFELRACIDSRRGWCFDGDFTNATPLVLPFGQMSAEIVTANGRFEADMAFGLNRSLCMEVGLSTMPVTVSVADGRVTAYETDQPFLARLLNRALERHHLHRVTALTLGLNRFSRGFTPYDSHLNRVSWGVRLTITSANQNPASAESGLRLELITTLESTGQNVTAVQAVVPSSAGADCD